MHGRGVPSMNPRLTERPLTPRSQMAKREFLRNYSRSKLATSKKAKIMRQANGITPAGHRVVILPEEVETVTASGIILFTASQQEKEELAQVYGRVVAIGPDCWRSSMWDYVAGWLGFKKPWAKVGDRVVFGKYAGLVFPGRDGGRYRIINDRDVVAVISQLNGGNNG